MTDPTTANQSKNKQLAAFADHLRSQRLAQSKSTQRLAKTLGLRSEQLMALESWQEAKLPPEAFRVGLLNKYAKLLDQPPIKRRQYTTLPHIELRKPVHRLVIVSQVLTVGGVSLIAGVIILYLGWLGFKLVSPPRVTISQPQNLSATRSNLQEVTGTVAAETAVQINGQAVGVDDTGKFTSTVYLREGENDVIITAINSLGHKTELIRRVYR